MSFLTAEWRNLTIANYVIESKLLMPFLPAGTELDLWQDQCFLSLVGFKFVNTKLLGFKIPFHTNFEEVNLRFYVKRFENNEWKRGVVFIKEIVPKFALSLVANTIYNENYETMPMTHKWSEDQICRQVEYRWKKKGKWHSINVKADLKKTKISPNSVTEFIIEHYWGYAKINDFSSNEYEVTHPKWDIYKTHSYLIDVDFKTVYGKDFEFMNNLNPHSVMLAEGSPIKVESKRKISI